MGSCLPRSQKPASAADTSESSVSENVSEARPEVMFTNLFPTTLEKQTMSILLAFAQDDKQCNSFQQAARLANYKCNVVKSMDSIMSGCIEHSSNVIIVDTRQANQIESLCKIFSTLRNREGLVLVAVLESNDNTVYDVVMQPLIKVGFTRQFLVNLSVNVCLTELQCIEYGELQNRFQFQMAQSFLAAIESCSDSVEITNAKYEIKYINNSFEHLFGYTKKEAIGKAFLSLTSCIGNRMNVDMSVIETMKSQMQLGIPWKGVISVCKKNGESCVHRCHVIPILGQSGHVRNFVVVRNEMGSKFSSARSASLALPSGTNRALLYPDKNREATSHVPMTIEAPMTKVIHMISLIQASCSRDMAESLDNVLEVLRSSELYVPIQGDDMDNEMTTELLEGLMTGPTLRPISTTAIAGGFQRKSISGPAFCPRVPQIACGELPLRVQSILNKDNKWEFNIIKLEKLTDKKPLQFLCMKIFERFSVVECLQIDQVTLNQWVRVIESHYRASNTYHNSTHAGDVLHAAAYFLNRDTVKYLLDCDEKVTVLLAAVIHDIDHPGKTNAFLINSNSHVAQLYNDLSVLESHHVSYAFRLTHQDVSIDIFKNLPRDKYRRFRQQIIDMVLATDMSKHMEHLSRFMHTVVDKPAATEMLARRMTFTASGGLDNTTIIKRMLIKCSDVSNSARPRELSIIWAERISEEYYQQTDDEREQGLPVVMPLFDRRSCNLPTSQLGFMNLFIIDMFDVWHSFCNIPDLVNQIRSNHEYWKLRESQATASAVSANPEAPAVPNTAV